MEVLPLTICVPNTVFQPSPCKGNMAPKPDFVVIQVHNLHPLAVVPPPKRKPSRK